MFKRWITKLWGSKLFKRLAVCGLVLAVASVVAVHVLSNLNKPAEGAVVTPADTSAPPKPTATKLTTSYFHTLYPGRYTLQPASTQASASLQTWALQAHQTGGEEQSSRITLLLTNLPTGGVTEDSSYKLYKSRPDLYQLSQANYDGDAVTVAKRRNPTYEYVVLWPHGPYLLTVVLTAGGGNAATDSDLQVVLDNLRW